MVFWRFIPFLALTVASHTAAGAEQFDIESHYTKDEFRVPMRDGVHLFTIVYTPKDTSTKYPILMTRTPYSVAPYDGKAYPPELGPSTGFDQDGFIFVFQDVRGRFMSEGEFVEMKPEENHGTDESTDAYDTIDWLLKNVPNNNGKVGLVGTSYPGFYTSAGLINAHPALVAASPQAPISDLYMGDDSYHNGAFFLLSNFDFYTYFGKQHNPELPPAKEKKFNYGTDDGYEFYLKMGPLINSDEKYFHHTNPYWTDTIQHPVYDAFWKTRNILPHLKKIKPAVLIVGGWFDAEDLAGTLNTFRAIETQSPETAAHLVMGPWSHGGWIGAQNGSKLGDISFGANTVRFFQDQIELPFFRHYLKGAPDPALPKAYVFETGKNVWRKQDQWPPADTAPKKFYLQAPAQLCLEAPADPKLAFDQYTSDPANPVNFLNKPALEMNIEYMDADQRFAQKRPDVLTYETAPLEQDLTVGGPISPSLWISTTGSDSDFVVKLIDVYPSEAGGTLGGYEQLVRGEPFRGKFRNSFENAEPFRPGELQQIHFTMPDVYHCFLKGHRLMVQIQSSWFPLVDRNPQTFTNIPTAKSSDFITATERIYHSAGAASFIELDVAR